MSDSTEMTIEFLRARLLSERSVSRAAKDRADQLAKKVMELEEQLRLVNVRRKKAEVAALEAVSILQTHGVDDGSEVIDSCSDKDESPIGEQDYEEASTDSRNGRSKLGDATLSSEARLLPSNAGSLSWKSHSCSLDSCRRLKGNQFGQRERQIGLTSNFESTAKYNLRRSCQKIKQSDMGLTTEDERHNDQILDPDEQREGDSRSDLADNQPGIEPCIDVQRKEYSVHISVIGTARDEEMDRVLEQQAQFISQHEEEEKAQREWERKYNENKSLTLDHSGLGEQSSMADNNIDPLKNSDAPLDQTPKSHGVLNGEPRGGTISDVPSLKALGKADDRITVRNRDENVDTSSNGFGSNDLVKTTNGDYSGAFRDALTGQTSNMVVVNRSEAGRTVSARGNAYLSSVGKQNKYLTHNHSNSGPNIGFGTRAHSDQMLGLPLTGSSLTANDSGDPANLVSSVLNDQPFNRQYQTPGGQLGDVLQALQRAKISLKQELCKPALPNQGPMAEVATTGYGARPIGFAAPSQNSVESAGLFRLPTDNLPTQNSLKHDVYRTGVSLSSRYSQLPFRTPSSESLFMPYHENASRNFLGRQQFDNYHSDVAIPGPRRSSLPYLDSAADKSRTPFRSISGASLGKQEFSAPSDAVGVSSSRYSLPYSDLSRDITSFPRGFGSFRHNQPVDNYYSGFHESTSNMYSPPYLGTAQRTQFYNGTPNYQKGFRNDV